ncbi:hypothetical protein [Yinghuangia sp. YIM S10712]|uniref:hypothetical protein n=1 Tax=Yinghuangia sp. YIM S10712 TaxID=3436930 RepID=UPI003F535ADE
MSWAAHELESYVLQKHIKTKVSFLAILLGCFWPDMITKGTVYGFDTFGVSFHPENPHLYHRGWPGVGFTHSLFYGVVVALIVLWLTKSRAWALGLLIGHWAHVFTDICDDVGAVAHRRAAPLGPRGAPRQGEGRREAAKPGARSRRRPRRQRPAVGAAAIAEGECIP